jgi:hypothetical protein
VDQPKPRVCLIVRSSRDRQIVVQFGDGFGDRLDCGFHAAAEVLYDMEYGSPVAGSALLVGGRCITAHLV